MISTRSMTGYGNASLERDGRSIAVEAKAVNHRFLDVAVKAPRSIGFLEDNIRKLTGSMVSRGHIDITIQYQNRREDAANVTLDEPLLAAYTAALDRTRRILGDASAARGVTLAEMITAGILKAEPAKDDQSAVTLLCEECAASALSSLIIQRELEGGKLRSDLRSHLDILSSIRGEMERLAPLYADDARQRLETKLRELLDAFDEQRVLQEIAIMAERAAIDEELSRLGSHVSQIGELLDAQEPIGRKLDFLIQECLREANTIGSKSQRVEMTKLVVEAKGEIEKMREQAQNVE